MIDIITHRLEFRHGFSASVVVDDPHIFGSSRRPAEAQAELVVHADAVLICPIGCQGLELVVRGRAQVVESARNLQLPEFAPGDSLDAQESPDATAVRQFLRVSVPE